MKITVHFCYISKDKFCLPVNKKFSFSTFTVSVDVLYSQLLAKYSSYLK